MKSLDKPSAEYMMDLQRKQKWLDLARRANDQAELFIKVNSVITAQKYVILGEYCLSRYEAVTKRLELAGVIKRQRKVDYVWISFKVAIVVGAAFIVAMSLFYYLTDKL